MTISSFKRTKGVELVLTWCGACGCSALGGSFVPPAEGFEVQLLCLRNVEHVCPNRSLIRIVLGGDGCTGAQIQAKRHHKIVKKNHKSRKARCLYVACVHLKLLEGFQECRDQGSRIARAKPALEIFRSCPKVSGWGSQKLDLPPDPPPPIGPICTPIDSS
eukprot:1145622-Pelagomonas_calceolata.AAC.2